MSYNGSGTFVINTAGQPVVANTVISATVFNALTADLATGLSTAITKDGQTTITANIPFGSNKITGLGAGTAATDAANLSQVQSTAAKLVTVTGTDTLTGTMSPALGAYAAGQLFYFIAGAANTGAMTINIDGLGAKSITRDGSTALIANDVLSGEIVVICYDGTRFQMINAANSFGSTTINGTLTVTGNAGFQANVSITSALSVGGVFAVTGASTLTGTATLTANPVLNGGTANGVLYLNGSKVATSGSAFVFDGTNVGIGTSSPANKLSINQGSSSTAGLLISGTSSPQLLITETSTPVTGQYVTDTSAAYLGTTTNHPLVLRTNTTERARIDSSGNFLIGTTSATFKFTLQGSGSGTGIQDGLVAIRCTTAANPVGIAFVNSGNTATFNDLAFIQAIIESGSAKGALRFITRNSDGSNSDVAERARITAAGNFGIGTASPASTLQVGTKTSSTIADVSTIFSAGGASASGGKLYAATFCNTVAGANNNEVLISFTPASNASATGAIGTIFTNSSNGESAMKFYTYGASDGLAERARITAAGNVGIGTSSPAAKLDVSGSIQSTATGSAYAGYFNYAGATGQGVGISSTGVGSSYAMFFFNNGVSVGNIYLTSTTTTYNTSSDRRLKNNIAPSPSASNVIDAIEIVSHGWKAAPDKRVTYGVIAQDLAKVAPEAVTAGDDGEEVKQPWGVDYSKLVPMLIKEMQSLRKRVAELEAR